MALKKLCSKTGCHKVVEVGTKYCERHQEKFDRMQKERYKEYQQRRKEDKEQWKRQQFYNSKGWRIMRDAVIKGCFHIDILEYYRTGKIIEGETIHHVIEVNEDWNARFDLCNLIYLTERNHRIVHSEYNKGKRERKMMQTILFELINKFEEEFK